MDHMTMRLTFPREPSWQTVSRMAGHLQKEWCNNAPLGGRLTGSPHRTNGRDAKPIFLVRALTLRANYLKDFRSPLLLSGNGTS